MGYSISLFSILVELLQESLRTCMYAAVQVLQLHCLKFYTLSWEWASLPGAMDSLFYHGCSATDAKSGSKMPRRLNALISLGLLTVTIAGCTGIITIAGCTGMLTITITITGTLNACKLCKQLEPIDGGSVHADV